jgi:hypothetical protein
MNSFPSVGFISLQELDVVIYGTPPKWCSFQHSNAPRLETISCRLAYSDIDDEDLIELTGSLGEFRAVHDITLWDGDKMRKPSTLVGMLRHLPHVSTLALYSRFAFEREDKDSLVAACGPHLSRLKLSRSLMPRPLFL